MITSYWLSGINTATQLYPHLVIPKLTDLYSLTHWLALSYCAHKTLVWMLAPISPAVLMYDFIFSAQVQRECWQPWAHWFMEDGATCPSVVTVKKRARPTFHLGHTSCVCDCSCMSLFYLFIYKLSHAASYEDGVKSHQLGRGVVGFIWNPSFSLAPPTCRRNTISQDLAVKTRMKTLTHIAVAINRGERQAVVYSSMVWDWCLFSLADFSAVPSLRHSYSPHNDVTVSPCTGREEKVETGLHYVLHSATQSPPRFRLRCVTVRQTPCTPPPLCCPLKWRGCGWFLKLPAMRGNLLRPHERWTVLEEWESMQI